MEIRQKDDKMNENNERIAVLEGANKTLKKEVEDLHSQAKHTFKMLKSKEKDATKAEVKVENMSDTIANLKTENKFLNI